MVSASTNFLATGPPYFRHPITKMTYANVVVQAGPAEFDLEGEPFFTLDVRVTVFGPAVAPVPEPPGLPEQDAYWDLPLESLDAPAVASGEALPAGYDASIDRVVPFRLGRLLSRADGVDDFEL